MKEVRFRNMDRISDLPDPILHHIMSFLTTADVSKLSILSNRFFLIWSSFPVIEFDSKNFARSFQGNRQSLDFLTDDFLDQIMNSILLRRFDTNVLYEFRVTSHLGNISSADTRFDLAISILLSNRVRSMDLDLGLISRYPLPADFASKSIIELRLKGFKIDLCNVIQNCPLLRIVSLTSCKILQDIKISCENLTEIELNCCFVRIILINALNLNSFSFRSKDTKQPKPCVINVSECENITYLSLNNVANRQHWIEEHVRALCNLKTFILNRCQDIEGITVRNHKLERLEICDCPQIASIVLKSKSLESFVFKGIENRVCNISFVASVYIKDLSIENAAFTDEWLEAQIAILGCLESLRLKCCNFLKKIRIFHEKLKILELSDCNHLKEADIDTPQLVAFVYDGGVFEFKKIVTRSYCSASISMKPWISYNNETFYGWLKLLSYFSHCKSLKVICNSPREIMIPEQLRERVVSPLYDLQNLEIEIKLLKKIDMDLIDSLLWLSPLPNNLQISSGPYSQLQMIIKFAYKDTTKDDEKEEDDDDDEEWYCCISKPIKCWRHCLTSVEIHSRDVVYVSDEENGSNVDLHKYFSKKAKILDSL